MKKYLIFVLFFLFALNTYSQLNEFIIQTYFVNNEPGSIPNVPWLNTNENIRQQFFYDLKNIYNFNTILFERTLEYTYLSETISQHFYKMAKNAGLQTILSHPNLWTVIPLNKQNAEETLLEYSHSDYNVIGYNIIDEPEVNPPPNQLDRNIDLIPQYSHLIKNYDSSLIRYSNLLASLSYLTDYGFRESYIQRYINNSDPNLLSFDIYPIYDNRDDFFMCLYNYALKSVENSIPFIYVLTPFRKRADLEKSPPVSAKTKAEFNYVIYAALSYGAKGIAYWPGFPWVRNLNGIYQLDFENGLLDYMSNLHQKLIDNSDVLLSLNFISAYHWSEKSTIRDGYENIHAISYYYGNFANDEYAKQVFSDLNKPVYKISDNSVPQNIVISFMRDKGGDIYFWLFNKSLTENLSLRINTYNSIFNYFDNITLTGNTKNVSLAAGEAKLFRVVQNPIPIMTKFFSEGVYNPDGALYVSEFFKGLKSATNMIFGNNSWSNYFDKGVTYTFTAENILINNLTAKRGSTIRFKAYKNSNTMPNNAQYPPRFNAPAQNIEEVDEENIQISIFPNPTSDILNVDLSEIEDIGTIEILNLQGILLDRKQFTSNSTITFDVSGFPSGLYFVIAKYGEHQKVFKVAKK